MATIQGKSSDGKTYNIGSEKGQSFISSAAAGTTMTGGDGSTWTKNKDGSTTISKNGTTYTVPGSGGSSSGGSSGSTGIPKQSANGASSSGGNGGSSKTSNTNPGSTGYSASAAAKAAVSGGSSGSSGGSSGGSGGPGGANWNGKTYKVGSDGKAPSGLSVGSDVVTGGGTYRITGVNADGTYQSTKINNVTTGTYSGVYANAPYGGAQGLDLWASGGIDGSDGQGGFAFHGNGPSAFETNYFSDA